MSFVGYFDGPTQTPTFDPGLNVLCPVCLRQLSGQPLKTISMLPQAFSEIERSYFFRAHRKCWNMAGAKEKARIESSIIDADFPASNGESETG